MSASPKSLLPWLLTLLGVLGFLTSVVVLIVQVIGTGRPATEVWIALGVFTLWGFFVRMIIEGKTERKRMEDAQAYETAKWGFHGRDGNGPWLNFYQGPLVVKTEIAKGHTFYSEWLAIQDGSVIVNPGESKVDANTVTYFLDKQRTYAWNGSTPKVWFFWFLLLGTPDWFKQVLDLETIRQDDKGQFVRCPKTVFWQAAHKATVVHDALYQYLEVIPIEKKETDRLFRALLKESGMPGFLAFMYYLAVRLFGGWDVTQSRIGEPSEFKCGSFEGVLGESE